MNTVSSIAIALAISALVLSVMIMVNDDVDPLIQTNVDSIQNVESSIDSIYSQINSNVDDRIQVDLDAAKSISIMADRIIEQQTEINDLKSRILQEEDATRTENANQLDVPEQATPRLTFNLKTLDNGGVQVDTYTINDVVYISGDASNTTKPVLTLKIRGEASSVVYENELAVNGKFTTVYAVPAGLVSGVYTATFSDGNIVDSIKFNVE